MTREIRDRFIFLLYLLVVRLDRLVSTRKINLSRIYGLEAEREKAR